MKLNIAPGKYVVAVSGGVDSVVLLDLLARQSGIELIVAHFNHGIRADSRKDEELVRKIAKDHNLAFVAGHGNLGKDASEATARRARYAFLGKIRQKYRAKAIITAHHQDDLIETALINMLRGTGWRGLASINNENELIRPLLKFTKQEIENYAKAEGLKWREDSTNADDKYLRNYLRNRVIPKMTKQDKKVLIGNIDKVAKDKDETEHLIATISQTLVKENSIDRQLFKDLPNNVASEILLAFFKSSSINNVDRKTVQKVLLSIKMARTGSRLNVVGSRWLMISSKTADLTSGNIGTV